MSQDAQPSIYMSLSGGKGGVGGAGGKTGGAGGTGEGPRITINSPYRQNRDSG
ncbi:hypothetical protein MSAN_00224700 [Mycena sanguinolenta]|uniref:Uncharacterized protein n=1 Tax=Mycena sanguinolenta TaxID=230812 RepID=A0A8H6ZFF1_9AGAR|nr:hypothetical protein MSAN_00224700 [Mycena sanguinolenta]